MTRNLFLIPPTFTAKATGLRWFSRKNVAQAGVLVFIVSNFVGFPPANNLPINIGLPLVLFGGSWILLLLAAALIPSNKGEE